MVFGLKKKKRYIQVVFEIFGTMPYMDTAHGLLVGYFCENVATNTGI